MKIRYKKKLLNFNLFFGIAWSILATIKMIADEPINGFDYAWIGLAVLSIGTYFYEYKNQYITIKNGLIFKNHPFSKKIKLTDIKQIKKFAGDYILKAENQELTINTDIIDKKSLTELNRILGELNLNPEKTPFAS